MSAYLLDSEGLSRRVAGDRRMGPRIKEADRADVPVVTTSATLVEAYHAELTRPRWRWALSRLRVQPVPARIAQNAIDLLQDAGLHGHTYAIEATPAAVALRQAGRVTVFTSDEDDTRRLCGDRVVIVKL